MPKRVLIMGLSGTGKTTLAISLVGELEDIGVNVEWFNADAIREETDNWDFTNNGRVIQCKYMKLLSEHSSADITVSDFIAPTEEIRELFNADYTVWVNTVDRSEYADTDALFTVPENVNYTILVHDKIHIENILNDIQDLTNE